VTAAPNSRPRRWALPPQPPETWASTNATVVAVVLGGVALAMPGLLLLPGGGNAYLAALVYATGGLLAVGNGYLLTLQAGVTEDRRLLWVATGFGALLGCYLARSVDPALPGGRATSSDLRLSTALAVVWLLALPVVALSAGRGQAPRLLYLGPPVLLAAAGLGAYEADLVATSDQHLTTPGRWVMIGCTVLGTVAALWWRQRIPYGNRGVWGCIGAALLLTPVVALVRGTSADHPEGAGWSALLVELVPLVVCFTGLYVISLRGYLPQARQWRALEAEVRRLRASSALLPGLSVTPEDDAGLPDPPELQELLTRGNNLVALQPVLELATMTVVGQEALARFGGRIPTDRWFRAAVLHGVGADLERITLERALGALPVVPAGQFLAINASPAALHDERILELLDKCDLSRLVVEITEHDAVNDYGLTREALSVLRRRGARIAVDDVGAGFASLRHVLLLQPDVVKLDTSLTRDVHDNARQQAIVRALVRFSTEVGATVLAEGIEVPEQVTALVDAGVALGQGWHLGIPVQQGKGG